MKPHSKLIGIIFGPNGSGKGTLANNISIKLNYHHVNNGSLLRKYAEKHQVKEMLDLIDAGEMISDDIVENVLIEYFETISHNSHPEIILEGFPRRKSQVHILKNLIEKFGYKIGFIIVLNIPLETILERVRDRVVAPDGRVYHMKFNPPPANIKTEDLIKRLDDREDIVEKRYENYMVNTLECLSDKLFLDTPILNIDARKSIEEIMNESIDFIKSL